MSDTPKTDAFKKEWPDHRRHNWPCSFESAAFAEIGNLERQLAERTERIEHLKECAKTAGFDSITDALAQASYMRSALAAVKGGQS